MATKTSAKRQQELELEVEYLKASLKETIEAFTAIRQGEVDAFVVPSPQGAQVYILEGIERRYRAIVETMNVAALILPTDGPILYCNSQFAQMLDLNLTQVMGGSLQNLIAKADRERCAAFLRECLQWRSKVDLGLVGSAGKQIMAELSGSPLQLEDSTGVCLVVTDITERRRAEAALRQNERKLRLITENLRDTVFAYDMNRQLIFVNSTFEILTGYTIGELYARNFINYLHPDDATRMMSLWEDVFQGKAFVEEFRIVRKDGQIRWSASSWSPLLDEQGQQIGIQGRETDITGRKRVEETLRESEEKYRTLGENIPGSEFRCEATPPHRVIHQSTEIENLSGYPASDFLDGSILFDDIELPEDVEKINQAIESAIADKKSYIIEYRLRHADGSIHWVSERGHVTYSEQGEPLWLDGISFDITEQKQIEKALQESEERYRLLFENAQFGIGYYDASGHLLLFNDLSASYMGGKRADFIGKTISELFGNTSIGPIMMERMADIFGTGESKEYEDWVQLPSGDKYFYSVYNGIFDAEGKPVGLQIISHDISERKRAEEEIQSLAKFPSENPYPILRIARDGMLLYINEAGLNLLPNWHLQVGMEAPLMLRDVVFQTLEGGTTQLVDLEHCERVYSFFVTPIVDAGYANLYGRDITERKRAEEAVRVSFEKYKVLFEAFPMGLTISDKDGKILEVNKESERLLGLSQEEHSQRKIDGVEWQIIRPDGSPMPPEEYASTRALKDHYIVRNVEMGIVKGQDQITWINVTAAPIPLEGYGVAIAYNDITERKQAETEREILLKQLNTAQNELRTLAAYLQTALEDERTSIAREIHDEFGQRLTAFKMDLAWLSTHITPAEPQVQEKMAVMTSMLQELIQHTRQVASNLRPALLDDLGLNAAIEWYANDWSARHGKGIFIHLSDRELPLNREMSTALYRILQETLTNVARHAEATRVYVYLEMAVDHVILQVRDNGRGISQKEIHSSTALGLLGMRERAYQFGGGLEIIAKPGKGTTVQVRLPLKQGT